MKLRVFAAGAFVSAVMGIAEAGVHVVAERPLAEAYVGPLESVFIEPSAARAVQPGAPHPLTPELRARGYNACWVPENGFGGYTGWKRLWGGGQLILPRAERPKDGGYDVVIHFHGHEAVRHAFVEVARRTVLVGIDLGNSSGPYEHAFADPSAFPRLLSRVTEALVRETGDSHAHIRHLSLSSWSAGFGAVRRILDRFGDSVDAVVLLDSLHANYTRTGSSLHGVAGESLSPFVDYVKRAAAGEGIFFYSHSSIVPPGYASTTEVADYLIDQLGGVRTPRQGINPLGAELVSGFDRGGVHVSGYLGGDKPAHCGHVELLAEAVRDYLEPAWEMLSR